MKHLLTATAIAVTLTGIWQHDWRTIIAGLMVAVIWPLIRDDVTHVCTCAKGRRCLNCVERDGLTSRTPSAAQTLEDPTPTERAEASLNGS